MVKRQEISKAILRISLSLIFLYFGFVQVYNPDDWIGYIPSYLSNIVFIANNIVILNGILEITLGIFLFLGLYTRFASLVLSFHLLFISISIGFNPLGVRDFGLALSTFVIFLNGADEYSFDSKFFRKSKTGDSIKE